MARPPLVEDLRRTNEDRVRFDVSMAASVVIGTVLVVAGAFVALVLPELFSNGEMATEDDNDELTVLLALTLDNVRTGPYNLSHVPFDEALLMLLEGSGSSNGLDPDAREFCREMLAFILGEDIPYRLRAGLSSVTSPAWELLSLVQIPEGTLPTVQTAAVTAESAGGGSVTLTVTLEFWPWGSS